MEISFKKIFILVVMLGVSASMSIAGTWTDVDDYLTTPRGCSAKFSGQIEPGDFTSNIDYLIGKNVCLDSPGGSLSEVTAFLELMQKINGFGTGGDDATTMSTRVKSGERCESACAILFMMGTSSYRTAYPQKILEPGAKLGFHSPFIDPRMSKNYEGDVAYLGGIQTANLLTSLTYKTSSPLGVLPVELLSIVFGTAPDKMYYVDTCVEMYILGISTPDLDETQRHYGNRLLGFKDCEIFQAATVTNTLESVTNAADRVCASSHVVNYRKWFSKKAYSLENLMFFSNKISQNEDFGEKLLDYSVSQDGDGISITMALSGGYHVPNLVTNADVLFCLVTFRGYFNNNTMFLEMGPTVTFGSMFDYDFNKIIEKPYNYNTVQAFGLSPLNAKFDTIGNVTSVRQNLVKGQLPTWARSGNERLVCGIEQTLSRVVNVQNFTNLRRESYLQARIVGRVPLGASVKIRQPGTYWRPDKCAAACNGKNQNAIKQCIDNNDVWIEVQYNGRKGFLSRKFLE